MAGDKSTGRSLDATGAQNRRAGTIYLLDPLGIKSCCWYSSWATPWFWSADLQRGELQEKQILGSGKSHCLLHQHIAWPPVFIFWTLSWFFQSEKNPEEEEDGGAILTPFSPQHLSGNRAGPSECSSVGWQEGEISCSWVSSESWL